MSSSTIRMGLPENLAFDSLGYMDVRAFGCSDLYEDVLVAGGEEVQGRTGIEEYGHRPSGASKIEAVESQGSDSVAGDSSGTPSSASSSVGSRRYQTASSLMLKAPDW